jgi:putative transposase
VSDYKFSIKSACHSADLSRSAWYRRPAYKIGDTEVVAKLNGLMERWPRWGFWKCFNWLRTQGHIWNHKRVWRIYCAMKLNLPRRKKRMLLTREKRPLMVLPTVNQSWSLDFMHDTLYCGKRFRTLNVLDEGMRECLGIEVDTSLSAVRVVRVLEQISAWRGLPKQLRLDNGPEFISAHLVAWCQQNNIEMLHIQPGKPNQNAYIERFNRTFRHEVLNTYLFTSLDQVRDIAWAWMIDYNEQRPHDALNGMTPTAFREKITAENSNLKLCA